MKIVCCARDQKQKLNYGEFMFLCKHKEVGEGLLKGGDWGFYINIEG